MNAHRRTLLSTTLTLAGALGALPAAAHISLEQGGTHKSRYGDAHAMQKEGPCGRNDGQRGEHVYTYESGQTIQVSLKEYIPHPGYFRFAFDADGDDDFKAPASIKPLDAKRACPLNPADQCGALDLYNSPAVLPNMDYLEPHLAAATKGTYTFDVKLPDVECTNCTLQVIQVMEDDAFHGPFNPEPGHPDDPNYIADIYYQCIDIVLKAPASKPSNAASAGDDEDSGCAISTGQGSGAPGALLAALGVSLGAIWRARRWRARGQSAL
jgi:hypothetical protein